MTVGGVRVRPGDTLLVERARDYLAGGPADARSLVERICRQSATPPVLAERIATELFAGRTEFERGDDGLWRLAGLAGPAGEPSGPATTATHAAAIAAALPAPSFEEWKAQRDLERASGSPVGNGLGTPGRGLPAPVGAGGLAGLPRRRPEPARSAPALQFDGVDPTTRLCELSYSVVDVETTGGSPYAGHRITEIAAVSVRGMEVCEIFETLVNPQRVIPPQIVKLTGITMEMVRDKPPFRDVAADVVRAIGGHVFVAHNVAFDWQFVSTEVARASAQTLEGPKLCTVRLARKLLPQLPSRSLGFVARHYDAERFAETYFARHHGPRAVWRHRAAGDAVATAYCLVRLLRDAADRGCETWGDVHQLLGAGTSRAPRRRSAMPGPVKRDGSA